MIAWVDVETTGLDPRAAELLEVGIIITDDALFEAGRTAVLVKPVHPNFRALMVPEVVEMHGDFLDQCQAEGLLIGDAQDALAHWVKVMTNEKLVMAGSTVGFDRAWLKAKMPWLESLFHYRSIDVSTLKELNARWGFAEEWAGDRDVHRALPDLEDSISELRWYREVLCA